MICALSAPAVHGSPGIEAFATNLSRAAPLGRGESRRHHRSQGHTEQRSSGRASPLSIAEPVAFHLRGLISNAHPTLQRRIERAFRLRSVRSPASTAPMARRDPFFE